MPVIPLSASPRAGSTRPPARRAPAGGDIVPLRAWTHAERKAALERLCAIVEADPRGGALARALRQSIARH